MDRTDGGIYEVHPNILERKGGRRVASEKRAKKGCIMDPILRKKKKKKRRIFTTDFAKTCRIPTIATVNDWSEPTAFTDPICTIVNVFVVLLISHKLK